MHLFLVAYCGITENSRRSSGATRFGPKDPQPTWEDPTGKMRMVEGLLCCRKFVAQVQRWNAPLPTTSMQSGRATCLRCLQKANAKTSVAGSWVQLQSAAVTKGYKLCKIRQETGQQGNPKGSWGIEPATVPSTSFLWSCKKRIIGRISTHRRSPCQWAVWKG